MDSARERDLIDELGNKIRAEFKDVAESLITDMVEMVSDAYDQGYDDGETAGQESSYTEGYDRAVGVIWKRIQARRLVHLEWPHRISSVDDTTVEDCRQEFADLMQDIHLLVD